MESQVESYEPKEQDNLENQDTQLLFQKQIYNSLISVFIAKSGLSLRDINEFILSHYDALSTEHVPIEKPDVDTTELFTTLFGDKTKVNPANFATAFTIWYQHIYGTHIGNIVKQVLLAYHQDEIANLLLSIIREFEVFVEHKRHAERVQPLTGGGSRVNFVKVLLLLISCLLVFAPSGKFIEKTEVQELVNKRISSSTAQVQIPDTIVTNAVVNLLKDNLFKDIKSTTGVEIVDYFNYWRVDDKYITDCIKHTRNVLQSFSGITEMVSEYIIDTKSGKYGEGILSNIVMPSFSSVFDTESMIQFNNLIQKSTKEMNIMITIFTTVADTLEHIKSTTNPKIKGSVEVFLRLVEPRITEKYGSQFKKTGGKRKKPKRTTKKRKYCKKFTTISKRSRKNEPTHLTTRSAQ